MIHGWVASGDQVRAADCAQALHALAEGSSKVWLDFEGENEAHVREALSPIGVHPLVIEDRVLEVNRPKVDDYGRYLYLVVHSARWDENDQRPALREIDILVGEHVMVTYHNGETRSVTAAREILARRPELLGKGPAYLMHFLLDTLVDHYLPIMDRIAESVAALEEAVFEHDGPELHARIVRLYLPGSEREQFERLARSIWALHATTGLGDKRIQTLQERLNEVQRLFERYL